MAKRGGTKHLKRVAAPKAIFIHDRKANIWLAKTAPGTHTKDASMPLLVLIRDILGLAMDTRETKKILNARLVEVDGKIRTDTAYPIGLMDSIAFQSASKFYRMIVDRKGRLAPVEIEKTDCGKKIAKVTSKHSYKGKTVLHFHDGKNIMSSDVSVKVGDSVVVNVSDNKLEGVLKLQKGASCFITEGTHAGMIAKLEALMTSKGERKAEAKLSSSEGDFITVADYLLVVDEKFKGVES